MEASHAFARLSNTLLAAEVIRLAACERATTAELIACLAEFDRRRLYLEHGFTSLFAYCVDVLHLSEHAAYGRIEAARAARKFPCVLRLLGEGRLTLTNLCLLSRHLTDGNYQALLQEAAHKRKDDVQKIVARLAPKPDAPSLVRKIPVTPKHVAPAAPSASAIDANEETAARSIVVPAALLAPKPAVLMPLAPERYKLQVTIDEDTREVLKQAQDLMRHALPNGDPAVIVARALRLLVDDLLKKKAAITERPRSGLGARGGRGGRDARGARGGRVMIDGSRAIPAAVRREVWSRDRGRCAHEGPRGRCDARSGLEYHHVIPYAMGGPATADNLELRCRAHNAYQARLDGLGWDAAARHVTDPARGRR